ncbi:MFS transporter [Halomarina litorea]|uniref:MFS transporter n=1 Tax=Halomarina litorea TaxID=2961595 RepID=UPI0020C479B3|nr:MFS transporter [Halomarina sp. BCD28]
MSRQSATPDESPRPPTDGVQYALLALGSAAYLCLTFTWFSLPAFLPTVIEDLGISSTAAGVLAGAVPLTYVPVALVSGLVIDRVGSRRAIGLGLFGAGVAHALRGVASGFPSMLAFTLLFGVFATGLTFGLPKLVSELFPAERTSGLSSVYVVGSYVGTASAFAVGRPVLGSLLGWRDTFLVGGAFAAGVALCWLLAVRLADGARFDGGDPREFSRSALLADVRAVVASRPMRLLVVVGTMYLLLVHGLQGWLTALLEASGFAPATAARTTSLLIVAQIAGAMVVPALADRWDRRRAAVVLSGLLCLSVLGLLESRSLVVTGVVVVTVGVGLGGLSPLVRALPVRFDDVGPGLAATAVGLVFAVGEAGGFLGPFLVGALEDATGSFVPGVVMFGGAGLVIALAGLGLVEVDG